jgi:hypothetical protein
MSGASESHPSFFITSIKTVGSRLARLAEPRDVEPSGRTSMTPVASIRIGAHVSVSSTKSSAVRTDERTRPWGRGCLLNNVDGVGQMLAPSGEGANEVLPE